MIDGHVVARVCVEAASAAEGNEVVELIGHSIRARGDVQAVDLLLDGRALLLRHLGQAVVKHGDGVEVRLLGGIVEGTYLAGALEHDVLKVVGDARAGAVARAGLHDHGAEGLRKAVVLIDPHFHSVGKGIGFDFQGIGGLCVHRAGIEQADQWN